MLRRIIAGHQLLTQTCHGNFSVARLSQKFSFLGSTVLSSYGTSSHETEGSELRKKDASDEDTQQLQPDAQVNEPSDLSGIIGFTDCGFTIPTEETSSMMVNGVRYDELPVIHIRSTKNNTMINVSDHTGTKTLVQSSCGMEGFKNVKKSTNVAAQATGLSVGTQMMRKGIRDARVMVKGIGVGRLPSIKGVFMAGVNIVSISDNTVIPHAGPRARKRRRL